MDALVSVFAAGARFLEGLNPGEPRQLYSRADLHGGQRLPAYPRLVMVWPLPLLGEFLLNPLLRLSWWEVLWSTPARQGVPRGR